ncbi:putative benzoate 4-monooxygenase cytochrome P450 [Lophiotrema nucula]|uniref:Putative benzoate 4-monooxygenase cytochrome P450 n=1 Tax=Lophiotrema nucula TaxID=690887 RepID=A0A6A5Z3R4_9PLEO|nr:putative benzoate 4-monooxygenase cytochrome P450 [Lophiotrema nucula]
MALLTGFSALGAVACLLFAAACLTSLKAIQRLWFHPLAKVPGPWYAAISSFYEFWWDCPQAGRYWVKIEEMHKNYGPIVRINPWEVHINDPAFMDTLFSNSRMQKDSFFYGGFGIDTAAFSTVSADLHRVRRGAMANFFSKASITKLEPRVLSRVKQLCGRLQKCRDEGKPADLSNAYRCLATDVTTDYAVPNTRNFLDDPEFKKGFNGTIRDASAIINWNRHIPFLFPLVRSMPRSLVAHFDKDGKTTELIDYEQDLYKMARAVVDNEKSKETPTILNAIFEAPNLPTSEKTFKRVMDETQTVIGAGTETTGNTLAVMTYHLLTNPPALQKLKAELTQAAETAGIAPFGILTCKIVEPLPYLQATLKEALRMAIGVCGRLPRVNPDATMTYNAPNRQSYTIPSGYAVSMSIPDIHFDPDVFTIPRAFNPDRWLNASPSELARMDKSFVPFGRGARQCIGLELAKQEILLVAANVFRNFEMELWETTARDIEFVNDFFAPFMPHDRKGVWVKIKG